MNAVNARPSSKHYMTRCIHSQVCIPKNNKISPKTLPVIPAARAEELMVGSSCGVVLALFAAVPLFCLEDWNAYI